MSRGMGECSSLLHVIQLVDCLIAITFSPESTQNWSYEELSSVQSHQLSAKWFGNITRVGEKRRRRRKRARKTFPHQLSTPPFAEIKFLFDFMLTSWYSAKKTVCRWKNICRWIVFRLLLSLQFGEFSPGSEKCFSRSSSQQTKHANERKTVARLASRRNLLKRWEIMLARTPHNLWFSITLMCLPSRMFVRRKRMRSSSESCLWFRLHLGCIFHRNPRFPRSWDSCGGNLFVLPPWVCNHVANESLFVGENLHFIPSLEVVYASTRPRLQALMLNKCERKYKKKNKIKIFPRVCRKNSAAVKFMSANLLRFCCLPLLERIRPSEWAFSAVNPPLKGASSHIICIID